MRVVGLGRYLPYITDGVCSGSQLEVRFANKVDDLVRRQEISRIEIYAAVTLPDNDLPDRKSFHDVRAILEQAVLHPPFVVVEKAL
jgi:hypothetical protein